MSKLGGRAADVVVVIRGTADISGEVNALVVVQDGEARRRISATVVAMRRVEVVGLAVELTGETGGDRLGPSLRYRRGGPGRRSSTLRLVNSCKSAASNPGPRPRIESPGLSTLDAGAASRLATPASTRTAGDFRIAIQEPALNRPSPVSSAGSTWPLRGVLLFPPYRGTARFHVLVIALRWSPIHRLRVVADDLGRHELLGNLAPAEARFRAVTD